MAHTPSRIPTSPTSPVPILIPSLRVTAPTPGHTPPSAAGNDASLSKKPKSVKSVRIQEPVRHIPPEVMMERLAREQVERQMEARMDRARVAPWDEPQGSSRGAATLKKKGKENKKAVMTTLSGFRVLADPSPPLPAPSSQPLPTSRNASTRVPLSVAQERARVDSKATLLSFRSNRSTTSSKTASSIATTSTSASIATNASVQSAVSQSSGTTRSSLYTTVRDAPSSQSKRSDGLEKKKSKSRLGLDSLFNAWGTSKDADATIVAPEAKEKEKSLWARTVGRKSMDKERAQSPAPSSIGRRSGEARSSMETERARSPTPSIFSGRSERTPSPPLIRHGPQESISTVLDMAARPPSTDPGLLAPPANPNDLTPEIGYPGLVDEEKDDKEDGRGPRFMRSIRSIATFRQKQKDERTHERGRSSSSSGSSFEAGAPSTANTPAKPSIEEEDERPTGTVRSSKEPNDGTVRSSIFHLRSVSRASNHSDTGKVRKSRSSTGTFDSVSSRDVNSLPPHLLRNDYPTPPQSQLQAAAATVEEPTVTKAGYVARMGSKMRRPGLQGLFDGMKKHKSEKSQSGKPNRESWVEVERPSFECSDDGKELIALAMPYVLPPSTEDEENRVVRSASPPPPNPAVWLPDLLDPTPKKDDALRVPKAVAVDEDKTPTSTVRLVVQRDVQQTPKRSLRPMSDGAVMDFSLDSGRDFSAIAAANSDLSDLISRLDLTVANTPEPSPSKPLGSRAPAPPAPAFLQSAIMRIVANPTPTATPKADHVLTPEETGTSSLPTPAEERGFKPTYKALPSLSNLKDRQNKTLSATARDEWMDLFPTGMGPSASVDLSNITPDPTPVHEASSSQLSNELKKIDFGKAIASSKAGTPNDTAMDSATLGLSAELAAVDIPMTPARAEPEIRVTKSSTEGLPVPSRPANPTSVTLTPSTLEFVAGNYLAYTADNMTLAANTTSIYESAQESLSKYESVEVGRGVPEEPSDDLPESLARRAQSPPPDMPLPPTPETDLSFSFLMPGRMPSRDGEYPSEPDTTLSTPPGETAELSDEGSPASRLSTDTDGTLDFTETYNELAGADKRKSFVKYVAHVSEEMYGDQQYLSNVLKIDNSSANVESPRQAEETARLQHSTRRRVPTDSFSSLPSMYNDRLPGNSLIMDIGEPSALDEFTSFATNVTSKQADHNHAPVAFPQGQANRDSFSSYTSCASEQSYDSFGGNAPGENETQHSIPSISSYGAVIKPGMSNPMGYTSSERRRLDSTESSMIRPLDLEAMASMDEDQLRRRFNRQSNDSVASTWSYHAPVRPLQFRGAPNGEGFNGPPPAYLNNNKRNSLMRNRGESADSHSVAHAYQTLGAIAGIVANHSQDNSRDNTRDSIISNLSDMSPMSIQRRGRPAIGDGDDDKMFLSANPGGMLQSIVTSPGESEFGLSRRPSFDSPPPSTRGRETDDEHGTDDEDSLFPSKSKRVSFADSLFSSGDDDSNKLAVPALFQLQHRKPRPVSAMSQDSVFAPGPDDTVMSMLDGGLAWAPRSVIENSPSVHAAQNKPPKGVTMGATQVPKAHDEEVGDEVQTVRFSESRMSKVLEALRTDESMEKVALKAAGLGDRLPPAPRITKPAPPSVRKKLGVEPSPRVSVAFGTVPDTPPYTSSEAGSTSSIDLPQLHAALKKTAAPNVPVGTPIVHAGRARAHGQGHRRYSGHIISTITEETASLAPSLDDRSRRGSVESDMDVVHEYHKSQRQTIEKKQSMVHELRQSQVLFPGKTEEEEYEDDDSEMPTTVQGILTFLAKSQNKFKPRTDIPTRPRTRSRTNSRPTPYPRPERQQAEEHTEPVPPLPDMSRLAQKSDEKRDDRSSRTGPSSTVQPLTLSSTTFKFPIVAKAEPAAPSIFEDKQEASSKLVVPRPRTKSGDRRQALAQMRRAETAPIEKVGLGPARTGFVLSQAAKLDANGSKPAVISNDLPKAKRAKPTTATARENEAAGMLMSPTESLRISRPKPKGRPGSRAAPILLRN